MFLERLTVLTIIAVLLLLPLTIPAGHSTGTVYLNPATTDKMSLGSSFTIAVQVANIDPYNGWDIKVQADPSVINATNISIRGNALHANYSLTVFEVVNCINGAGSGCSRFSGDGMGIAHSSASALGGLSQGISSGLLFTITFKVTSAANYSPIQFGKVVISDGSSTPVTVTDVQGTYGSQAVQPDFTITSDFASFNVTQGQSKNLTITVDSIDNFVGPVDLSASSSIQNLQAKLSSQRVLLSNGQSASISLNINSSLATPATSVSITVTSTSGMISHSIVIDGIVLTPSDFILTAIPSLLLTHASSTNSSRIILQAGKDFSGNAVLQLNTSNGTATLSLPVLELKSEKSNETRLTITTPHALMPFHYTVDVTATVKGISHSIQIVVRPPNYDVSLKLSPETNAAKAGSTSSFTINATSADYFEGSVFMFAAASSGRLVLKPSNATLHYGSTSISTLTVTTDNTTKTGPIVVTVRILGLYFLRSYPQVAHSFNITLNVLPNNNPILRDITPRTILGLSPLGYFGIITGLAIALSVVTVRALRKRGSPRTLLD